MPGFHRYIGCLRNVSNIRKLGRGPVTLSSVNFNRRLTQRRRHDNNASRDNISYKILGIDHLSFDIRRHIACKRLGFVFMFTKLKDRRILRLVGHLLHARMNDISCNLVLLAANWIICIWYVSDQHWQDRRSGKRRILIQNEQLEQVDTFPFLGSLITEDGECMTKFRTRLNRRRQSGHDCRKYGKVTAYRF